MPRNGAGTYFPPAGTTAVSGQPISSAAYNNFVSDIGAEMTNSVDVHGESPMQASFNAGNHNVINLLDPVNPQDGATKNYVDLVSLGFRNRFVNGGMRVDQRNNGNAQTITAGAALAFTVDQWYAWCTGANVTGQQTISPGTSDSPAQTVYQITGAASNSAINFGQRINAVNSFDLAGGNATLQVLLNNSVLTTVSWAIYYANTLDNWGTVASPTRTLITSGTFPVGSGLQRFSTSFAVPGAATTGLEIVFSVANQTNGTWQIGNAQIIPGTFASQANAALQPPFERRPLPIELAICRFFYNTTDGKNRLLNADMALDQRNAGAVQTIVAGAALAYTVDRWYAYATGASVNGQRATTAGPPFQYVYNFNSSASNSGIGFGQRIEAANSYDLAGGMATLSFYTANSFLTSVTWAAYYANSTDAFGTLASPTKTLIATGTVAVIAAVARYSISFAVPAAATTGIEIILSVGAQTAGTWFIGGVQLESGSYISIFDRRERASELEKCQRYYEKSYDQASIAGAVSNNGASEIGLSGLTSAANTGFGAVRYATAKRVAPAVTLYSPSTGASGKAQDAQNGNDISASTQTSGETGFSWGASQSSSSAVMKMLIQWTASAEL